MKLEQNDKSLLFSSTEIPDIFFTEFLPSMNGDFLKVYLYILFLAKFNKDIKINDLSKTLALPFPVIQDALRYLEEQKLIIKLPTGYSVTSIQEVELSKLYSPKVTTSYEDLQKSAVSQERAKAIENINEQFFSGVMSPTWYSDIELWFNKYGFTEQVMLALFSYAFERRALNRGYILTVADAWSKNKIRTFDDLEAYEEKADKLNKLKKAIAQKLGITRNLTTYEEEYVIKWTQEYNFDMPIIELALKKSSSLNTINFNYFDKILTDWHTKGLSSVAEIQTYQDSVKDKDKRTKQIEQKTLSYNYTQSTFDNLDSLYDN